MSVTPEDVRHVAALARLAIAPERMQALVQELNGILAHMDDLQEVDVSSLLADDVSLATPLRDDAVNPIPLHRAREAFAPLVRDGFFLVPRLATHSEESGGVE